MPVEQPPLVPGAGPRPFRTRDDVVARLDDVLRDADVAPIRDALIDALTALLLELQFRNEYAIAQADVVRATVGYLTSLGGDDRGMPRAPDEQDVPYRSRLLTLPAAVTEEAITLGVNAILAPFTTVQCQLVDAVLDRWFVGAAATDATRSWHSFIGAAPQYPDRLYAGQEIANGGVSRPNSDPGGARLWSGAQSAAGTSGRQFLLLLPDLGSAADPSPVSWKNTGHHVSSEAPTDGFFVGKTVSQISAAYVRIDFTIARSVYRAIEGFVNSVIGQSIRWTFINELGAA